MEQDEVAKTPINTYLSVPFRTYQSYLIKHVFIDPFSKSLEIGIKRATDINWCV